jgi:hypothetical protein
LRAEGGKTVNLVPQATRFELDPLPMSANEVLLIMQAVANGGLTEHFRFGRVEFELRLEDGSVLTGSSTNRAARGSHSNSVIHYPPYKTKE